MNQLNFNNKRFVFYISCLFAIATISLYFLLKPSDDIEVDSNSFIAETIPSKEETMEEINIAVHVTGEVVSPGLISLPPSSRIADAISASGGPTATADLNKINLAYELQDGQKIYIPSIYDEDVSNTITTSAGNKVLENETTSNAKININSATDSELESLPGIGKSTASKILDYRNKHGKFKSIEDIMNVSRHWRE